MNPYQADHLLTMTSRGSTGGEPRVDGSDLDLVEAYFPSDREYRRHADEVRAALARGPSS